MLLFFSLKNILINSYHPNKHKWRLSLLIVMLSNIWYRKFNTEEESRITLIENFLIHMLMIISKTASSKMNIPLLKSPVKEVLVLLKKDISIKSLLINRMKFPNIENILTLYLLLITQKYSDSIWMLILLIDSKNHLKWLTRYLKLDPKMLVQAEAPLEKTWSLKNVKKSFLNSLEITTFKTFEMSLKKPNLPEVLLTKDSVFLSSLSYSKKSNVFKTSSILYEKHLLISLMLSMVLLLWRPYSWMLLMLCRMPKYLTIGYMTLLGLKYPGCFLYLDHGFHPSLIDIINSIIGSKMEDLILTGLLVSSILKDF